MSPPGSDPGHKSPACPASCSHSHRFVRRPMPMGYDVYIIYVIAHSLMPPFPPEVNGFRFFGIVGVFVLSTICSSSIILRSMRYVTLAPKFGSFDTNVKIMLKILSLEVDSAYHTECSMKAIRNGHGLLSASALLVLFVTSQRAHHQIVITSRTGRLSINEHQRSHVTS